MKPSVAIDQPIRSNEINQKLSYEIRKYCLNILPYLVLHKTWQMTAND